MLEVYLGKCKRCAEVFAQVKGEEVRIFTVDDYGETTSIFVPAEGIEDLFAALPFNRSRNKSGD